MKQCAPFALWGERPATGVMLVRAQDGFRRPLAFELTNRPDKLLEDSGFGV